VLREAAGISQEQLAARSGLARSSIANIEAGRQGMDLERAALVARGLGAGLADLITPDDLPPVPELLPPHNITIRRVYEVECRTCQAVIDAPESRAKALETKRNHIAENQDRA
jgi:transcriptional regulator with XRE-family HTH domain